MEIIKPKVQLAGMDGNAFSIMGRVISALKKAGNSQEVIDAYKKEAMSGDYDNLLCVTLDYIDEGEEDEETEYQ